MAYRHSTLLAGGGGNGSCWSHQSRRRVAGDYSGGRTFAAARLATQLAATGGTARDKSRRTDRLYDLLQLRFGDALAFVHVQRYWPGRTDGLHGLARSVASLVRDYPFSNPYALNLTELVLTIIFAALAIYCLLKVRRSWGLFALAALVIPLSTGSITSVNRYTMVLVPCFVSGAILAEKRNVNQMVLTVSTLMLAVFFYAYTSTMVFLG